MTSAPRDLITVEDFHDAAKVRLPKMIYDYYVSGARDEISLARGRRALDALLLLPRVMRNVTSIDTATEFFGRRVPSPILIAATAMHKMATPEGECATARAAAKSNGTLMMLSSLSTTPLEEVATANAGKSPLIFQLYVLKDRAATLDLVRRAERSGYCALAVTVDAPVLGTRYADVRNRFRLPEGLELAHYKQLPLDSKLSSGEQRGGSGLEFFVKDNLDASLTWDDLVWLKKNSKLPILLKGVHAAADAELCVHHGLDGVIVSNHGARQLDTVPSTIELLPEIIVRGRVPVYVDGGFRRGTDVVKALALGAKGVFLGRPVLWGLGANGEQGVVDVLRLLHDELVQSMRLCGVAKISEIDESLIWRGRSLL